MQFQRDAVADPHLGGRVGLALGADVEPQLLEHHDLLPLVLVEQVDRFAADHPRERPRVGPQRHRLPDQLLRVPTADRLGIDEAVVIDVGHQHADLVAVTGEQQPRTLGITDRGDHIAVDIGPHLTGMRLDELSYQPLNRLFVSRGAGGQDGRAKKVERCG